MKILLILSLFLRTSSACTSDVTPFVRQESIQRREAIS